MKSRLMLAVLVTAVIIGAAAVSRGQEMDLSNAASPAKEAWTPNQLDNLVAPIALYPDPLLSQMLVASTYPLEVVEASQWLDRNENLQGQELLDAAKQQNWDPSIQTLVAVPDALNKLAEDIGWTTDLGDAFLAQQADVMNAIQRMRVRAQADGRLSSTSQQVINTENENGQQVIEIVPANPDVIYVPIYDPYYVWGVPAYGFYPALFYPDFGFGFGVGFDVGFCFGGWGGWNTWGWSPNWFGHTIIVNDYFFNHYGFHDRFITGHAGRSIWSHNPVHRMHVPYASPRTASRFGSTFMANRHSLRPSARSGNSGPRVPARPETRFSRHADIQGSRGQTSNGQGFRNPPRAQYQVPHQYRAPAQQSRHEARVVPFGQQAQRNHRAQAPLQSPSTRQIYRAPQARQYKAPRQFGHIEQPYRSAPQTYRAPHVQRFQAPQQFRSAPRFSAPRFSGGFRAGGGFNRSVGGRGGRRR